MKKTEELKLTQSDSPHVFTDSTIQKIMGTVVLSLLPIVFLSGFFFGPRAWGLYLIAIATAVITEAVWFKLLNKPRPKDLSAVVTALLLTMNLPPSAPWYFPVLGTFFAIIIVKEFFGGLGYNFLNPALGGRALLVALFFPTMFKISWANPPFGSIVSEAVTQATPLAAMRTGVLSGEELWATFLGNIGGRLGETSALMLLVCGGFLIWRKIITPRIPLTILATVAIGIFLFAGDGTFADWRTVLGHLLSGGLLLGAFFMATDYASSPATRFGEYVFAVLIGILIVIFRLYGATNEGVSYAILIMNCAVPLIDRVFRRRVLGEAGRLKNVKIDL